MPERLFQILDTSTRKPVPGLFFQDKPTAKHSRQQLNKEAGATLRFIVSPGPDHRRYRRE